MAPPVPPVKARGVLRTGLLLAALVLARFDPAQFTAGCVLLALGLVLRLACKGYLRRTVEVVSCGPYAFHRHPFYLGNLMVDAALLLCAGLGLAVPVYAVAFLLAYRPRAVEEEEMLLRLHGPAYEAYRAAVPRVIPRITPWPGRARHPFSFPMALAEKEVSRALRLAGYPLLLLSRMALLPDLLGGKGPALAGWRLPALLSATVVVPLAAKWVNAAFERQRHDPFRAWVRGTIKAWPVLLVLLGLTWVLCPAGAAGGARGWLVMCFGFGSATVGLLVTAFGRAGRGGVRREAALDLLVLSGLALGSGLPWTVPPVLLLVAVRAHARVLGDLPRVESFALRVLVPGLVLGILCYQMFGGPH